ncbi:YbaN family protein [Candidatus Parcubacteria bacterium]|nr:YbaN family protein [Candidatus Parcubacteria bacterium]
MIGHVSLLIGIFGVIIPVIPTSPFVVLAVWCYARSSERFHKALLNNRWLGPALRNWQEHRSISRNAKIWAVTTQTLFSALSIYQVSTVVRSPLGIQITLGLISIGISYYVLSRPTTKKRPQCLTAQIKT